MSAKTTNLKIGIFVIIAVTLLVAGLLAFGAKSYFAPKTYFETAVEGDVAGLSVGSGVQLRGVPIGKVTRITFSWHAYPGSKSHGLVVEFAIDGDQMPWPQGGYRALVDTAVKNGMRVMVKSLGITGTSILSIETLRPPPPEPELDYTPKHCYVPSAPGLFTRMLEDMENSLQNVQNVDFAAIAQGVTNALGDARLLANKLQKLDLEAIATNANVLMAEFKTTAEKIQDAIAQVQETLKGMELGKVTKNADSLLTGLHDTNARLQTLLTKLNAVPMQDTVAGLQETLESLNDVLLEMKRYPSGFFLGDPPLPATGVQTVKQSK
jgi:ABC-type transporter Mla subunit MlaD